MNDMYHRMTPGMNGYPHAEQFATDFTAYAREHGALIQSQVTRDWTDINVPKKCLTASLEKKEPAALLVLFHKAAEMNEYTWHWMTVTEYDKERNMLTVSSCGNREVLDAEILLQPDKSNQVRIVTFCKVR